VKKLKARFVVRGYEQIEGVDYFDTFSPVVQWSTIRLMFVLSIMLGLKTCQVDYTLAFVQAKASPGTYIEMPKLFDIPGKVLACPSAFCSIKDITNQYHAQEMLQSKHF
jgi:hypothetical protein